MMYLCREKTLYYMIEKCKYYIKHEKERQQIADNGYGKIVSGHTYDIRFKEIFNIVFNKN